MRFSNVLSIPRDTTHHPASAKSSCCLFNLFSLQIKRQLHKPPTLTFPLHPMEAATQLPTLSCLPAMSLGCCQEPLLDPRVTRGGAQEKNQKEGCLTPYPPTKVFLERVLIHGFQAPATFPSSSPGTLSTAGPTGPLQHLVSTCMQAPSSQVPVA